MYIHVYFCTDRHRAPTTTRPCTTAPSLYLYLRCYLLLHRYGHQPASQPARPRRAALPSTGRDIKLGPYISCQRASGHAHSMYIHSWRPRKHPVMNDDSMLFRTAVLFAVTG